ncbi:hypothetical protein BDW71DRAFT_190104 [Aspergillus fruticulosus]
MQSPARTDSPLADGRSSPASDLSGAYQLLPVCRSGSPPNNCSSNNLPTADSGTNLNNVDSINNDDSISGSPEERVQGYSLQRFIARGLILLVVPPLLTVYFIVICFVYRAPDPAANGYTDHQNGQLVFYSWWILGLFGLGISRYGLSGVEAAMLQEELWHADNAMALLLLHSGQAWSGFGGWIRCLVFWIMRQRKKLPPMQLQRQRLWWLLCLLSALITIALPLSGLSMELFDGFVMTSTHPLVLGYSPDTYLTTHYPGFGGWGQWRAGGPLKLPGAGIVYTPLELDRSKYAYLSESPNRLPTDDDVPDIFLASQAKYPVAGDSWGLRLSYNCSIVESMSELSLLPRRRADFTFDGDFDWPWRMFVHGNESIRATNSTMAYNVFAYIEQGTSFGNLFPDTERSWDELVLDPDILEYVIWQARLDSDDSFNKTVSPTIPGMGHPILFQDGDYRLNDTFLEGPDGNSTALRDLVSIEYNDPPFDHAYLSRAAISGLAAATGIRCRMASQFGFATLHPDSYAFSNFRRHLPARPEKSNIIYETFGSLGIDWLLPSPEQDELLQSILESTKPAPPPGPDSNFFTISLGYFQASQLRTSVLCAWAVEALRSMYDGLDPFENTESTHLAENLTVSRHGKILGPGAVPPHIPATLFSIWAIGCIILALRYGFQRRWAETLDGYSFLRFGVDISRDELRNSGGVPDRLVCSSNRNLYEHDELLDIPGLIGDSRVHMKVGHIGLVKEGCYARRDKLYQ